jgi:2-polyprenyl-3-methyl-5-hydroxy-6-metoxy-1,4-benzoquinol methylase
MPCAGNEQLATVDYADHYAAVNDLSAGRYEAAVAWYRRLLADVLCDLPLDAAILDVGCGAGLLLHALRASGFTTVSGIDPSASLCAIAQARGLPVRCEPEGFVETASARSQDRYDVIFLLDVLEHIPVIRHMAFLRGLHGLLRPAGRLVVSVPNANSALAARWRYIDWTHETAFTEHSLRFVLTSSGFRDVRLLVHEFFARPRLPFLIRRSVLHWWLHRLMRGFRRLQVVGELGAQGWSVPLSLNLLAVATRDDSVAEGQGTHDAHDAPGVPRGGVGP